MKKLLVLVLMLVMASFANASLYTATSDTAQMITITFTDPTAAQSLDVFIDYTNFVAAGGLTSEATLTGSGASIANLYIYTAGNEGADVFYLALANLTNWSNPTVLAALDLNGTKANSGNTSVSMNLLDSDLNVIGTVTVLIPEPATIILLSLGGLLFRKR